MLTLKSIPTVSNDITDVISRRHESIILLHPAAFQRVWNELRPFTRDLMPSTASTQRIPRITRTFPFPQHVCVGSSGVNMLAQDVSRVPGKGYQPFAYCFLRRLLPGTYCSTWQSLRRTQSM